MFHVEVSTGINRARVFNLSGDDLLAKVVQPWLQGEAIEMGDRSWEPRESSLRILEGPRMENPDLAFGQGWANAERRSRNVTQETLEQAPPPHHPDAFLVEAEAPEAVSADVVAGHGGRAIEWSEARARLDSRDPEIAAVILVVRRPAPANPRT